MIRADYFVVTMLRNARVDAHYPSIVGQYVHKPREDRIMQYYGFRGENSIFCRSIKRQGYDMGFWITSALCRKNFENGYNG